MRSEANGNWQTYHLSHGELYVTASMTIAGQGPSASVIDQQTGGNRVLELHPAAAGSSVTVSGVQITGGDGYAHSQPAG